MVQFQIHVGTSVVCGRDREEREEEEKKEKKTHNHRRMLERGIYYKNEFKILPHFPRFSVQNIFIAQGTILPHSLCTLYSAVIPSQKNQKTVRSWMGAHMCMYAHTRTAALVRKAWNTGQDHIRTPANVLTVHMFLLS